MSSSIDLMGLLYGPKPWKRRNWSKLNLTMNRSVSLTYDLRRAISAASKGLMGFSLSMSSLSAMFAQLTLCTKDLGFSSRNKQFAGLVDNSFLGNPKSNCCQNDEASGQRREEGTGAGGQSGFQCTQPSPLNPFFSQQTSDTNIITCQYCFFNR